MKTGLIIFAAVLAALIAFQVIGELTKEKHVKIDTTGHKVFRPGEYRDKKGNAD